MDNASVQARKVISVGSALLLAIPFFTYTLITGFFTYMVSFGCIDYCASEPSKTPFVVFLMVASAVWALFGFLVKMRLRAGIYILITLPLVLYVRVYFNVLSVFHR